MSVIAAARSRGAGRAAAREGMPLRAHLVELRRRLLICAVAVVIAMAAAFAMTDPIISALTEPIRMIAAERGADFAALNFDSVTSAFDLRLRIALGAGLALAAPIWLAQIWLFLVPGLTRREMLFTAGFLGAAIPLFFGGCYVGWAIAPHAISLMSSFVPDGAAQFYQSTYYYDFVLKLVLVVGVAFVLPVLLVLLNVAGVLGSAAIIRGWRIAVLAATLFAAAATPAADIVSMLLLAGILVVLYLSAAGVSYLFDRRRARRLTDVLSDDPRTSPAVAGE